LPTLQWDSDSEGEAAGEVRSGDEPDDPSQQEDQSEQQSEDQDPAEEDNGFVAPEEEHESARELNSDSKALNEDTQKKHVSEIIARMGA
jgi:hypothetical protein